MVIYMLIIDTLSSMTNIEILVWALFIGFVIASFMIFYHKRIIGAFVRALLEKQASSPESALSIYDLGFEKNALVKNALRSDTTLRRLVWELDDNMQKREDGVIFSARSSRLDVNNAKFYIPEENRIRAELRYSAKGTDVFAIIIAIVLFMAVAYAALLLIPMISDLVTSML